MILETFKGPLFWILFMGGCVSTAILTPLVIWLARKTGTVDSGGHRKIGDRATPLLGGLAVAIPFFGFCLAMAVSGPLIVRYWDWIHRLNPSWLDPLMTFAQNRGQLIRHSIVLFVGGGAIVALGMIDDIRGLRPRWKLAGQILVALFVCTMLPIVQGVDLPLFGPVVFGPTFGALITVLWIVGLINAFNLIDGIDGLATGIAFIACAALAAMGVNGGGVAAVYFCIFLSGSLLGFLAFNFHPAKIFLGDTGSMFIGFALACLCLMGSLKSETALVVLAPMLALALPIFETLISMARRYIRGVPIFAGDNRHTHHRLLKKGYSQRQVALLLYAAAFMLAFASLLTQMVRDDPRWIWLPSAMYVCTFIGIVWLAGYLSPVSLRKIWPRRQRNALFGALARYVILNVNSKAGRVGADEIFSFCRRELGLRLLRAKFENESTYIGSTEAAALSREAAQQAGSTGKMKISAANGGTIIVTFEFERIPDEHERMDVTSCLAVIFETARFAPPSAEVLEVNELDRHGEVDGG